jgi:fluoride exporter
MAWIAVAAGGALGSLVRHAVNVATTARWPTFPVGTIIVNVVGCFVIGLLAGLIATRRLHFPFYWREFVFVGFLGGFTTFSTFSLETLVLARTHPGNAALNVGIQVIGSLVGVWLGYRCGAAMAVPFSH